MVNIGRDDGAASGDFVANEFRGAIFADGDEFHFRSDDAFSGKMELCTLHRLPSFGYAGIDIYGYIWVGVGTGGVVKTEYLTVGLMNLSKWHPVFIDFFGAWEWGVFDL